MQRITLIFSILFVLLFAVGCQKNELKKPTEVGFKCDINRNVSNDGKLVFTSGTINFAAFDVEGERVKGDDISFSREFPNGLLINFDPNNFISEFDYDIPQGVYNRIAISFETFDDNSDITIVCNGSYTNNSSVILPIRFEFMSSEYFSIEAEDYSNSPEIVLDKDTPANAFIKFNPIYWFDIVPTSLMENADLVNVNGTPTILINDSENDNIYEMVVERIDESTEVTFSPQ